MTYSPETDRQWWTEQWLDLINSYRFKKRLERGWKYAREGNVLNIDFQNQKVLAEVQGTEAEPYKVSLWLDTFSDEEWGYVIETMAERAVFSAKLLAGEMPPNIEEVFAANGLRLFPFNLDAVHSRCSCPDKANPCKHISAVYYLLGDRFSEDPFVLFQLRGRNKGQIMAALRQIRGKVETDNEEDIGGENLAGEQFSFSDNQLTNFWKYSENLEASLVVIAPPPASGTVLDVLGSIPLSSEKVGKDNSAQAINQYLNSIYQAVSHQAILSAMVTES